MLYLPPLPAQFSIGFEQMWIRWQTHHVCTAHRYSVPYLSDQNARSDRRWRRHQRANSHPTLQHHKGWGKRFDSERIVYAVDITKTSSSPSTAPPHPRPFPAHVQINTIGTRIARAKTYGRVERKLASPYIYPHISYSLDLRYDKAQLIGSRANQYLPAHKF